MPRGKDYSQLDKLKEMGVALDDGQEYLGFPIKHRLKYLVCNLLVSLTLKLFLINDVLNYFERLGKFKNVDLAEKEEGKRGRHQVIWEVV